MEQEDPNSVRIFKISLGTSEQIKIYVGRQDFGEVYSQWADLLNKIKSNK